MKTTHRSPDGTDFYSSDKELARVLDHCRRHRIRVKVTYDGGFGDYGKDHDFGYIGRTMGNPNHPNGGVKAPILVYNSRSTGGGILMDDHIIKVQRSRGGAVLWEKAAEAA